MRAAALPSSAARRPSRASLPTASRCMASTPGFGKLASVRIDTADLARLQRNIVLSHAAGVGEPLPVSITRLMMALKLASLAHGASGVQPATLDFLETMLAHEIIPVVPSQGSVGASGDLAPLAHMTSTMIGVGDVDDAQGSHARDGRSRARRAEAARARTEGRPRAPQRHAVLDRCGARRVVRDRSSSSRPRSSSGALTTDAYRGTDTPFDPRIHLLRKHQRSDRSRKRAPQPDVGQRAARLASGERRSRAGPVLPSLPAAGDGRVPRPAAQRRQLPRNRSQRRLRQSAGDGGRWRGALRRQLPRRARCLRGRHDRDGAV